MSRHNAAGDLFAGASTDDQKPEKRTFSGRDTGSGRMFEDTIYHVLQQSGVYHVARQQDIGKRDDVDHKIDFIVTRDARRVLVEAKWQKASGAGDADREQEKQRGPEPAYCPRR